MLNPGKIIYVGVQIGDEFSSIDFRDTRLNRRFAGIVEKLSQQGNGNTHLAMQDGASVKAAYRFFSNNKVTWANIGTAHWEATTKRTGRITDNLILVAHDTTYFTYGHHQATEGLCLISRKGTTNMKGLLMHSGLAMTNAGVPLGILGQKIWSRDRRVGFHKNSGKNKTRIPIKEKESYKWIELLEQICERTKTPEKMIHIGDREADFYEFFEAAIDFKTHYFVRVRHGERRTQDGAPLFKRILILKEVTRLRKAWYDPPQFILTFKLRILT